MCGIVGYIGKRQAAPILMAGLNRLEYRGYDSAGIAIANKGALKIAKRKGRVRELDELKPLRFKGTSGIAHTRWATNGEPSDRNAHPHSDSAGRYAVVHNGIIENAAALRDAARRPGHDLQLRHRHRGDRPSDRADGRRLAAGGRGERGPEAGGRHLWPCRHGCRASRRAGRGAQRQPGRAGPRRQGDAVRLGRVGLRAACHQCRPSRRRRDRGRARRRLRDAQARRHQHRQDAVGDGLEGRGLRQGRVRPLHAQGDRRPARGAAAHARAAGSSRASRPRISAASRSRRASCWTCAASGSWAVVRPTLPASWAPT